MEMREHKKETKCGFGGVSMYDQQGIEKKLAAKCGVQVREVHEVIMKDVVNPLKRRQEAWQTAKHRYAQQEVRR